MQSDVVNRGLSELRRVRRRSRGLYWAVALFSLFANMLMLTGPLYMFHNSRDQNLPTVTNGIYVHFRTFQISVYEDWPSTSYHNCPFHI